MLQNKFAIAFLKHAFFCLTLLGLNANAVTTLDLPDIGESTEAILSPEYERRLGQAFLNQIRRQTNIIDDPEIETYIQSIGYRLVAQSDNSSRLFTFFVVDDSTINAFAAPGGIVGINTGTIINSETESELAGVMAHEIAHVTQRHMARSVEMSQKMSIPMMAAMLGAILIATQDSNAGAAALATIQGTMMQSQINFTRSNEEESDRIGMQLLQRADFNPRGMADFFEKLQTNSRYATQAPEFLRTHPLTTNRIADSLARIDRSIPFSSYQESRTYKLVRAKLIVKTFADPSLGVDYYADKLEREQASINTNIFKYGLALAYMQKREYQAAREIFNELLVAEENNASFLLARADLEVQEGNYNDAIAIYAKMKELFPDHRPLLLSYANTLLKAKKPEEAKDILEYYSRYHTPDITYFTYLSQAEAESGNMVNSTMANAEYYFITGETLVAIGLLKDLLHRNTPKLNYYQKEKILSRISQLEVELGMDRNLKLTR